MDAYSLEAIEVEEVALDEECLEALFGEEVIAQAGRQWWQVGRGQLRFSMIGGLDEEDECQKSQQKGELNHAATVI